MNLLLKILFFLLAIFQINICEARLVVFADVISGTTVSNTFNFENSKVELPSVISENYFANTCKSESDLLDYRNLMSVAKATAAKGVVETASGILKPGGSIIGKAGSNASIRELSGGMGAAQSYWSRLVTSGAKPVLSSGYKGVLMELPNGGTVGFRTIMSRSQGTAATIDVNIPGLFQGKLKFNP